MAMSDLQRYTLKSFVLSSIRHIQVFVSVYFRLWFLCKIDWRISYLKETIENLSQLNTFRVRKEVSNF